MQEINISSAKVFEGGVGLAGEKPKFKNIKVGYSSDNDLDDAGDDLVYDSDFSTTSTTVSHDDNGKLKNTYDAWNRLVKVQFTEDGAGVTVQTAVYDGKAKPRSRGPASI